MWIKHLSSLQFLTYVAFLGVIVAALWRLLPGKAPPVRTVPYPEEELGVHDPKVAKYFVAGGGFLVLGSLHMVVKNLPWTAEWLARAGYAGHLVRDLSNTHVMIVGGGTLIATGLCWYVLPRIVGRPLASEALAQCAFWFTAAGLLVFYVAFVGNGIAIGRLVAHGWDYETAKSSMGKWYKVPVGIGAGIMGIGYWCFAANVFLTVFHARLVRVPKPSGHLWKYLATGAAGLTIGTVQGVIQVQPGQEAWLHRAGHAGEWIDPISHAHMNLVTGLTMLVAGAVFYLVPRLGGTAPSRRSANTCFFLLLGGSLAFYVAALYLGFHEGRLVVHRGLTPEQAEKATALHPYLIMAGGIAMFAAFWLLLVVLAGCFRRTRGFPRAFVLAGCAALAVGTLQGPVQAFPAVHELIDRGGEAGGVIVNLHAQLNMLGGLMVILIGVALGMLAELGARVAPRLARSALVGVAGGTAVYYVAGVAFSALEARDVAGGGSFPAAVSGLEPWSALVLAPAALAVLAGFGAYAAAAWRMTTRQRSAGRRAIAAAPAVYAGRVPRRVRRRSPAALAGYELPMALLGFPGIGWLFAGFPFVAAILLLLGPVLAWAVIPSAFSPYGSGPLRGVGWKFEFVWLSATALLSAAALYRAHRRRQRRFEGRPPRGRLRRRGGYRTRVSVAIGGIFLVLLSLPFVPAVSGIGTGSVHYAYQTGFTKEVTGQFLTTPKGTVAMFTWRDPQDPYPRDALRLHSRDVRSFLVRAAAVDRPDAYRLFDLGRRARVPLAVRASSPRTLALVPSRPLASGRYLFVGTHQGMFGGRDFAYLTVVPPGAPVTAISTRDPRSVPAVIDAFLPIAAALVAALFSALLLRSFVSRPAGQKALWAGGFALFAVAAAAEAAAQRVGWSPALFRTYYLAGGVLTVAYLGAGSAWLLLPKRGRDILLGALLVATVAAAVTVALAPVSQGVLGATAHGRPPANSAIAGHAFLWAIALNTFGSAFLIGGSLYSILRRQRVRPNVWIGGGALVVALATGLSRAGSYNFVYAGELLGIALMFSGFAFVGKAPARRPKASVLPAVRQSRPGLT
jgi:membrane protein implicated in regulation of membrane protease activity